MQLVCVVRMRKNPFATLVVLNLNQQITNAMKFELPAFSLASNANFWHKNKRCNGDIYIRKDSITPHMGAIIASGKATLNGHGRFGVVA